MKKIIAIFTVFTMLLSFTCMSVLATNTEGGSTVINTNISPTYTITIPVDTQINFNATSTNIGAVEVVAAQIEPDKVIRINVSYDKLKNSIDNNKTIVYALKNQNSNFTSANFTSAGDKVNLTVEIAQSEWDNAYAGNYSDTITFTVSYISLLS